MWGWSRIHLCQLCVNCFRFAIPAEAFGAHRFKGRAAHRLRSVTLEFLFASRYPTSPSQGSLLYESVARSIAWSLDRSVARSVDRSVESSVARSVARSLGRGDNLSGEEKRDTGATNPDQKRGFDRQKEILITTPDTIRAKMDKIRSGGRDYHSGCEFDCFLIVLIRFI